MPSGVSAGVHEAVELRDGDKAVYGGKGVLQAVRNVHTIIAPALIGKDSANQRALDRMMLELDGTTNKSRLGANAILAVSMAICKARAASEGSPLWQSLADQYGLSRPTSLPVPMAVIIEAGAHSDAGLAFQEFMILPTGFTSFSDAVRAGVETYHMLKKLLKAKGHVTAVGDEGACAPRLSSCKEAFTFIVQAIGEAGYADRIQLALDAAASEFFDKGVYTVDGQKLSSSQLSGYYADLIDHYPLVSIEDSHSEDDWAGFVEMKKKFGERVQLVGDDLLVTNVGRIQEAITKDAVNAVLIKLNQIGTVSETVDAVLLTQKQGWRAIVSHRGGDTEDTFMADFVVALQCGQIKTTFNRSERTAKYNQLLRIEEELGRDAVYESPFKK